MIFIKLKTDVDVILLFKYFLNKIETIKNINKKYITIIL